MPPHVVAADDEHSELEDHILSFHSPTIETVSEASGHQKNITNAQNNTITNSNSSSTHRSAQKNTTSSSLEDNWNTCLEFLMEKLDHKKEEEPLLLMYLEEPGRTAEMYGASLTFFFRKFYSER